MRHVETNMQDYERLREHALRLLALAQKARNEGRFAIADELSRLAADAFDQVADAVDRTMRMRAK
jgi:hypothetical protein